MKFSPAYISTMIREPIRYLFSNYVIEELKYDEDIDKTKIEISDYNDFNMIPYQEKPRILINRGNFTISKTGISDSMMEGSNMGLTKGLDNRQNMLFINGTASITIEARNEGTCELLADYVSHFLVWTRPFLCSSQGFKDFAEPLSVSGCVPAKEEVEIFQVQISIPYMMEEYWSIRQDALKLKDFFIELSQKSN